uniref:Uncharacterized protein n=1 Tax=Streptomyces sp. W75 TaxID=1170711 RepID=I0CED7_9ACTN|nr:Hypothetical protein pCQ4.25 [Streptomyces sp. W75]
MSASSVWPGRMSSGRGAGMVARTVRCRCWRSHTGPRPDGVGWRMGRLQRRQCVVVCVLGAGAAGGVSPGRGSVVMGRPRQ